MTVAFINLFEVINFLLELLPDSDSCFVLSIVLTICLRQFSDNQREIFTLNYLIVKLATVVFQPVSEDS